MIALGIDVGTQSLKVLVVDAARGKLAAAAEPLALVPGLPAGHSEQRPHDWLLALRVACRRALAAAGVTGRDVAGVGVSGQQHGLVALDQHRQVLRPAKLWNDVSSAPQCAAIRAELGDRLFARTGNALPPGFTGGKLRWLREHEPEHFARLRHILLPHDYVNYYLTGELTCEAGDASGTGFFDVRTRQFALDVLEAIAPGLTTCLPRLLAAGEPAGTLCATAAAELGLATGTLVAAGGGDNMMAAIGCGAVKPGIAVLSLGTSGTVFACAQQPICDPEGEIAAFCDSTGRWLPLGCTMNATVSTELTRGLFGLSLEQFEAQAGTVAPGAAGVLCLPFFTGERSPNLPHATGAWLGLTPANMQPGALARAAIEGATFALVRLLARLRALGLDVAQLRLTGGGSNSRLWQRIVAANVGMPVTVGLDPDAAALGAAVAALWTLERQRAPKLDIADYRSALRLDASLTAVEPEATWVGIYAERRRAYQRAVETLTPWFEA